MMDFIPLINPTTNVIGIGENIHLQLPANMHKNIFIENWGEEIFLSLIELRSLKNIDLVKSKPFEEKIHFLKVHKSWIKII